MKASDLLGSTSGAATPIAKYVRMDLQPIGRHKGPIRPHRLELAPPFINQACRNFILPRLSPDANDAQESRFTFPALPSSNAETRCGGQAGHACDRMLCCYALLCTQPPATQCHRAPHWHGRINLTASATNRAVIRQTFAAILRK